MGVLKGEGTISLNFFKGYISIDFLCMCSSEQCKACPDLVIAKEQTVCCLHVVEQKLKKDLYASLVKCSSCSYSV